MKITVLGCGALGQLWLTALLKQGHELQGWLRLPQPYCSINLQDTDGTIYNDSVIANDPDMLAQSDLLLVTLKAWQVSDAVLPLAKKLPETSPILLIHNGMGTLDELRRIQQPLLMGVTTHAARRDGSVITHVANGITHIGPENPASTITANWRNVCIRHCRTSPGMTISTPHAGKSLPLTASLTHSRRCSIARMANYVTILKKLKISARKSHW